MRQRLISAAVLVPLVVIVFLLGDPLLSAGIALLSAVGAFETSRLLRRAGVPSLTSAAVAAAITVVVLGYCLVTLSGPSSVEFVATLMLLVTGAVVLIAFYGPRASTAGALPGTATAALYPALLVFMVFLLAIAPAVLPHSPFASLLDPGRVWLLVLVLTVWSLDTFAYLVGRALPRGRMAPRISPGKTWSGAAGGTVAAIVVCAALVAATGQHWLGGALLGLVIAVAAQAGDLAESRLKRLAGVKDSGALIPGHGGILDRIDSFLFAAPAMFMVLVAVRLLAVSRPA
jgi:phosphatidate cytidylyltransferase